MQTTEEDVEIKLSAWSFNGARGPFIRVAWDNYTPSAKPAPRPAPKPQVDTPDEDLPF